MLIYKYLSSQNSTVRASALKLLEQKEYARSSGAVSPDQGGAGQLLNLASTTRISQKKNQRRTAPPKWTYRNRKVPNSNKVSNNLTETHTSPSSQQDNTVQHYCLIRQPTIEHFHKTLWPRLTKCGFFICHNFTGSMCEGAY